MDEDVENIGDDATAFGTALQIGSETTEAEKSFEKVLEDLREEEGLKHYSDVYTKLYDFYVKMKGENVKLKDTLDGMQGRVKGAERAVAEYAKELTQANATINKLRAEISEAHLLADAMHARELTSVEALESIRKTVTRLEKELEAKKLAGDDDPGAASAAKEREEFEKEKLRLQGELDGVKNRLNNALNYQEELEQRNTTAEEKIAHLEEVLEEAENNAVRTNRLVEHLKGEKESLQSELEQRGVLMTELEKKLNKMGKMLERKEKQNCELTLKLETAQKDQETANARAAQYRDNLDQTNKEFDKTKRALVDANRLYKGALDEDTKLRNEVSRLMKQGTALTKRFQMLEQSKAAAEGERDRLRQTLAVMEREVMLDKKQAEADRREIENIAREKEIMSKHLQRIQAETAENLNMLNIQEQTRKKLEHELELNEAQLNKQRLLIRSMQKDKDRMLEETIALNENIDEINEEMKLLRAEILDLKKALDEESLKCRQLTTSLDATRAEKNALQSNYIEALDEIQDLKQKVKMMAYQIEQLKEDITEKETSLKSCQSSLGKSNKRGDQLRSELQSTQNKLSDARAELAAMTQEQARLNKIIMEGDAARNKLLKHVEGLEGERDVLGAQLVRRGDELGLLYKKIRLLEITLHRGSRQYDNRMEDIRLLRLEIIRLRKEKNLLSKGIENMTDLRLEVFNIERELARERLKVKALEQAVQTPLNVHRWRKLHATDPDTVTLYQKMRVLQKKILNQNETLLHKDRELKETQNLYKAMKDVLAQQPSPDIKNTLTRTQRSLTQRTTKLKCLVAELSMRERQITDLKLELRRAEDYKQRYETLRALDADERRRLMTSTPTTEEK